MCGDTCSLRDVGHCVMGVTHGMVVRVLDVVSSVDVLYRSKTITVIKLYHINW